MSATPADGSASQAAAGSGTFGSPASPSLALGVIGNCAFSALVDERGRIVWCCLPRFDGDPVFNALLETGASSTPGAFAIEIEDFAEVRQFYEPNTAVLRTQLFDKSGQAIEITDFAPRFFARGRY